MPEHHSDVPVRVESLERRFGSRLALAGVSLEVARGEIVALAGANGSGKTTLLKILAGFFPPHAGRARVFGLDPLRDSREVARRTRFTFAPPSLFDELTAWEHVTELASLVGPTTRAERERVLEIVGLDERRHDRAGTFSFGMRQRLALALALLPSPELLILDEPTDGLDPLGVLELRGLLTRLREEDGLTILLAQHQFREVETLVDRIVVLDEGREVLAGRPAALRRAQARLELGADEPAPLLAALQARGLNAELAELAVTVPADSLEAAEAWQLAGELGIQLKSFATVEPSLEEVLVERLRSARGERGVPLRSQARTSAPPASHDETTRRSAPRPDDQTPLEL